MNWAMIYQADMQWRNYIVSFKLAVCYISLAAPSMQQPRPVQCKSLDYSAALSSSFYILNGLSHLINTVAVKSAVKSWKWQLCYCSTDVCLTFDWDFRKLSTSEKMSVCACFLGKMSGSVQLWTAWTSSLTSRWWSLAGSCITVSLEMKRAVTRNQWATAAKMEASTLVWESSVHTVKTQ